MGRNHLWKATLKLCSHSPRGVPSQNAFLNSLMIDLRHRLVDDVDQLIASGEVPLGDHVLHLVFLLRKDFELTRSESKLAQTGQISFLIAQKSLKCRLKVIKSISKVFKTHSNWSKFHDFHG